MTAKPDLKMAQERVVLSRKSLALTRAEKVPDVFIGSGFTFASFAKTQPVGLASASNYFGEGAFFTMSTEAPVFYQHQGEIQTAVGTASAVRASSRFAEIANSHKHCCGLQFRQSKQRKFAVD